MGSQQEIRQQICEIGRRMYDRRMVAANDGNLSVRVGKNEILCTPTGISKGFMKPEDICKVDEKGNVLEAQKGARPSTEIMMHLRVYEKRPDVQAVVHAHPVFATAFAVAGIPLTQPILPEAVLSLGRVPIAAYGTPSTTEIPDHIEQYLPDHDAILLENHGALTWSADLVSAYYKMESLEFYAELLYRTRMLGGARELEGAALARLYEIRNNYDAPGSHPMRG